MPRKLFYLIIVILILAVAGGAWYFLFYVNKPAPVGGGNGVTGVNGFTPFGSSGGGSNGQNGSSAVGGNQNGASSSAQVYSWPKVREIWSTPVGGFVASTTASSTFVRFADRGTGYVYDMNTASSGPAIISNTTVPLIYESYWAGNAMSAIFRYIKAGTDDITNFYVAVKSTALAATSTRNVTASSTATSTTPQPVLSETPYELRGAYFPGTIISMAVSPSGKQVFTIENVSGNGVGYLSNFDGTGSTKIFSTPLTQVDAFWPATGTLMMSTKSSATAAGYLYSINAKTGAMSEIFGGLFGLSVLPNPTGQVILYSDISNSGSLVASLYNIKTGSSQDLPFSTLADKCVWSRSNPVNLFCAVPTTALGAGYPDAWYMGTASTVDNIYEVETDTGTVNLVSNLSTDAGASIDAEHLVLDPSERFLYFMNKKDLSLWSIDLNQVR